MQVDEILYHFHNSLNVDLFAGGGGWSQGFEEASPRPMDVALNHSSDAIAVHTANHPRTRHILQDIYNADPKSVFRGRPCFILHASPACTMFSRARKPIPAELQARELGWRVLDFVDEGKPLIVTMENVAEWVEWGPLDQDGYPIPSRKGETWRAFVQSFKDRNYDIEWRILNAADFKAPTARHRLVVIARRDGLPILWPEDIFGPSDPKNWEPAHKHIDWSLSAPSIFNRRKPLVEATHTRIRKGFNKFVAGGNPFFAPPGTKVGDGTDRSDLVAAFLSQNHELLPGRSLEEPCSTICTKGSGQGLVTASFIHVMRKNSIGIDMRDPIGAQCTGTHFAEVRASASPLGNTGAFGIGFYSNGGGQYQNLLDPIGTITTKDRFAVVTFHGQPYRLNDIGFRFLTAKELWALQGFPKSYITEPLAANGKPLTATNQKVLIGNSVSPPMAKAVTHAVLAPILNLSAMRKAA